MPETATRNGLTAEQIGGMNMAQLRSEIKSHYERAAAIEKKYPNQPVPPGTEEDEVKSLLSTIDRLEDALMPMEQSDERRARIFANAKKYSAPAGAGAGSNGHTHAFGAERLTAGSQFIQNEQYKELARSNVLSSPGARIDLSIPIEGSLLDTKALVYQGGGFPAGGPGGAFMVPEFLPGLTVPVLFRELTILQLVNRTPTTSPLIEYVVETSAINQASTVPEATATTGTSGTKPESSLTYQLQSAQVRTVATWIPITNRMLSDIPAMRGIIDSRLMTFLGLTLESQMISGDGTGENLLGLTNVTGVNVQARGTDNQLDAIFKGMTQVRATGLSEPTATAVNPIDFQTIRLARENAATATQGAGSYLMGPPNLQGATTLWGKPLVQSLGMPQGTAITGAWDTGCMLFDREEGDIRVGWINDQFVRNIQTILAEMRAAFVVFRPPAFSKITGL